MEAFIELTKLIEEISFFSLTLLVMLGRVNQYQVKFFKAHFRSSLVEAMEAFTQ